MSIELLPLMSEQSKSDNERNPRTGHGQKTKHKALFVCICLSSALLVASGMEA